MKEKQTHSDSRLLFERLTDTLGHMHIAIAMFDSCGECIFCSPLMVEFIGVKPRSVGDFVMVLTKEPSARHHLRQAIDAVQDGQTVQRSEVHIVLPGDTEQVCGVEMYALNEENSTGLAVVIQDTSGQMSLRSDLEQIGRLAALGQITAGVAHEFNNIITSVLGWTQIAGQNTEPSSIVSSALEIIESNARRAQEIASRLLGVSRPTEEMLGSFSVVNVVEEVLRLLSWEMSNAGIQVVRSIQSEDNCFGDDNRIGQVFINIIRNAMDAMPGGGTLYVSIRREGDQVQVAFADTGPGMPKEVLDQIFDPFFTTKRRGDKQTHGGTGLGLAVCRDILEEHGGKIEVESVPKQGTRFAISLPYADYLDEVPDEGRDSQVSIPVGVTVLVADDEPDVGEMVRTILELKGANVRAVNSGEGAVVACKQQHFDAALIDFSMPGGLSGHELGRELLAIQPDLKLIFMSGREVDVDPDTPIADFLKKPFDLDDVQNKLIEALVRSQTG
ncbi:MAG: response regulator [Deltaproteobacteria bacterium]|nr:response regulator [Deltaproteobacteria bacterium]